MSQPTPAQILDTPMGHNDANATTIREYLIKLLSLVFDEGHAFSGKRPFGNSGWHYELYAALVTAGHITGAFDEYGGLDDCDSDKAVRLIAEAIESLKTNGGQT